MGNALIVDDDPDFCQMMAALVSHHGFKASTAQSLGAARNQMALSHPDIVLLDLQLPDGDGLSLLDDARLFGRSEVVLMTGFASLETSIRALRQGAADYLVKPVGAEQLASILSRVTRPAVIQAKVDRLQQQWQGTGAFGSLVGRSGQMQLVHDQVGRVAETSVPVLIRGESGTGKKLVARTVHELGRRHAQRFVPVTCAAMAPDTLAAELFGVAAGDAGQRPQVGLFEQARGGTLYLDEICDMPPAMQVKLLRVLETGSYTPVGADAPRPFDVRLVSATRRNPEQAVAAGVLRQDLYYRLNVFPLELPPLRERIEDLPLLAAHLLHEISRTEGARKRLAPSALLLLSQYHWPGNVRELRNALHQSYVMARQDEIRHPWLPRSAASAGAAAPGAADPSRPCVGRTLAEVEREVVLATLERLGNHRDRTAQALGISPKTLYNRLKKYGV